MDSRLNEIQHILQADPMVVESHVLERTALDGETIWVGYVVLQQQGALLMLKRRLQPILTSWEVNFHLVPISNLPWSDAGEVDEVALIQLPILEEALVHAWEQVLVQIPEVEEAAVLTQPQTFPEVPFHLSELIPNWKEYAPSINPAASHDLTEPHPVSKAPSTSTTPSLSWGDELEFEEDDPTTLAEALIRAAMDSPEHGIVYIDESGHETFQSYPSLLDAAQHVLGGLRQIGVYPGDSLIFQFTRDENFITTFWACMLGGFIPVPMSTAPTYREKHPNVLKLGNVWNMLGQPWVLTENAMADEVRSVAGLLNLEGFYVATAEELRSHSPDPDRHASHYNDVALLLLTSGSTGTPKAVMQTHANLLDRTASTVQCNRFTETDVSLNWMPIDHVGGIVMFHLRDVYSRCQQIQVRTNLILQDPLRWLDLLDRFRVSATWAPNFAFGLVNDQAETIAQRQWDLTKLRFILNAGEAIVAATARRFLQLLEPQGLPPGSIHPAWGMSETCSAVTFNHDFRFSNTHDSDSFVVVGRPIPGFGVRIVNSEDEILPEGENGRLQVKGMCVLPGYYENPQANEESFNEEGWFNTGDLGVLNQGSLTITGREKDVIIINGINYYSHEIESIVETLEEVETSFTAAVAVRVAHHETDDLAIFFHTLRQYPTEVTEVIKKIRRTLGQTGMTAAFILPVPKDTIPKTSIGKIQRTQLRKRFEAGEFDDVVRKVDILLNNAQTLPNWFFQKVWQPKRLPSALEDSNLGTTLLFIDSEGLGQQFQRLLQTAGVACVVVQPGTEMVRKSAYLYEIHPHEKAHYKGLWDALEADGVSVRHIVHLWAYVPAPPEVEAHYTLKTAQTLGLFSILYLIQTLAVRVSENQEKTLWVSTCNEQWDAHHAPKGIEHGTLPGFLKSLDAECIWLRCIHVDWDSGNPESHALQLLRELQSGGSETEVVFRQEKRHVVALEQISLPSIPAQSFPWTGDGFFLLTGGLGGLGTVVAQWLLTHIRVPVLIVGRTALPDRGQWPKFIERDTPLGKHLRHFKALEALEGIVEYAAADVQDTAHLRNLVATYESHWRRPLAGIFHLAGLGNLKAHWGAGDQRHVFNETPQTFEAMFAAKVFGTISLFRLLADRPQAAFIGFSSVNGWFGGASFSAYSAANSFLESYLSYQRTQGHAATYCFSWSLWQNLGMSEGNPELANEAAQNQGFRLLSSERGLHSMVAALLRPGGHYFIGLDHRHPVIQRHQVGKLQLSQQLEAYVQAAHSETLWQQLLDVSLSDRFGIPSSCVFQILKALPKTEEGLIDYQGLRHPESNKPPTHRGVAFQNKQEAMVANIWKTVLQTDQSIGNDDNFFDLGGNSILIAQVQSKLQTAFQKQITVVDLFQHPTVKSLAEFLQSDAEKHFATPREPELEESIRASDSSEIAIIGMAGRFPGAKNIQEFWENLQNEVESITFFSDEEVLASGVNAETLKRRNFVKAGGVLEGLENFDAKFFGFSPAEATVMDPQHRLFLECSWEALEDAGYDTTRYSGTVGVYGGTLPSTYLWYHLQVTDDLIHRSTGMMKFMNNLVDSLTTRVSYKLNLRGPSYTLQTACSTSLVAIHVACDSLRKGECDMALAGGVAVHLPAKTGYLYQEGGILSPDGHCRPFDANGKGTVMGDGVGAVVLKRYEQAIQDGDHIWAIVKGSAINNDGSQKIGYTAPSVQGQVDVIRQAHAQSQIRADSIAYVEAHGTATALGDPIEMQALAQVFQPQVSQPGACLLGSVKSNIGHLETAAGVAGVIKTALSLYHQSIPATLHFNTPNPQFDMEQSPFHVNNKAVSWPLMEGPHRAGVSAFGVGGTNAHLILEEAPKRSANRPARTEQVIVLSARTPEALEQVTQNLATHFQRFPETSLPDAAYTLQIGRQVFNHRRVTVCQSAEQLIQRLLDEDAIELHTVHQSKHQSPDLVFMFPGGGSQYVNMGRGLYETEPVFQEVFNLCAERIHTYLGFDLRELLYPQENEETPAAQQLRSIDRMLPVIFTVSYSIARLLLSWGLVPKAMIGHSLGEYVAACISGVLSLEEALKLVAARGRLMKKTKTGAMLSVELPAIAVESYLSRDLSLGVINTPDTCVLSGTPQAVEAVERQFIQTGVKCQRLHIDIAAHSALLEPILGEFDQLLETFMLRAPAIPFLSNVTGTWITSKQARDPQYWCQHLRKTVRFDEGLTELLRSPDNLFLEIGPGTTLTSLVGKHPSRLPQQIALTTIRHPKTHESDVLFLLRTIGRLWAAGVSIDWEAFHHQESRQRVPLPTYPFEQDRFWAEAQTKQQLPTLVSKGVSRTANAIPPRKFNNVLRQNSAISPSAKALIYGKIERKLKALWQEALGVSTIGSNDNFFELGGSSLMAVALCERISQEFKHEISPSDLMRRPTIKRLEKFLLQPVSKIPSVVMPLQTHGSKRPFFCVHDFSGSPLHFVALVKHLGKDRPFYGFQAPGVEDDQTPLKSIEAIATRYLKAITALQPEGPYCLGGWSFGGLVAYEMAHQLQKNGEKVALLATFDTGFLIDFPQIPNPMVEFKALTEMLDNTSQNPFAFNLLQLHEVIIRISHLMGFRIKSNETLHKMHTLERIEYLFELERQVKRIQTYFDATFHALQAYHPKAYEGAMVWFRAEEVRDFDLRTMPNVRCWQDWVAGPMHEEVVPGNHVSLLEEPHVLTLAQALNRYLDDI